MDKEYFYQHEDDTELNSDTVTKANSAAVDPGSATYTKDRMRHSAYVEERRGNPKLQDGINEGSVEIIANKLYFLSSDLPP